MGRDPSKKEPVPIREVLPELIRHLGEKNLQREEILVAWEGSVGRGKSLHARIQTFEDGILTVKIDDPTFHYELSLEKETILRKLRKKLGGEKVREIRFRMGPLTP